MKVFVTGATGYIGRVVVEKLHGAGHHVVGLARSDAAAARLRGWGVTPHPGDLCDATSLARGAREADGVIHLAATLGPDAAAVNRAAVAALLGALESSGKPLVYTSGTPVYGDTGAAVADDEESPLQPPGFWAWRVPIEQDVLAATGRAVRGIVVRPATVYGRGGGAAFQPLVALAHRAGIARYIGAGTNRHVTIHVDDLAALYVLALERAPAGTVLNAAAGTVAMKDLAVAISHVIGRPGAVASWTIEEPSAALGGRANFFALNHQVSHARAILLLEWDPRASSPLYDVAYGSYRSRPADDLPPLSDPASARTVT